MRAFKLPQRFKLHHVQGAPELAKLADVTEATSSKEELLKMHSDAFTIRRVEVMCDSEYKQRKIRGFLHLYDGQEGIAVGTNAALKKDDSWITTYRCHGVALVRGCTPTQVFAELFGKGTGISRGKGGSMHLYNVQHHFYGGAAIVGAHVPCGTGLAFAHRYKSKDVNNIDNVNFCAFGDGAASQGQVYEAANMAMLWKLPVALVIENNEYGMGTSVSRSSSLREFYKMGGEVIPGVQVNGTDALAVREAVSAARRHMVAGNGPVYLEILTYRFHGHSMSDPGISYRTREEVEKARAQRDPIELIKQRIVEAGFATADELKEREREIRTKLQDALTEAANAPLPKPEELVHDVFTTGKVHSPADDRYRLESEKYLVRLPDRSMSRMM